MPKNQIHALLRKLRLLEGRRDDLVESLLREDPLIKGSLSHVLQRCGNLTCHCARKPAHPVWHLARSQAGEQRCQLVRQADVEEVRILVARAKSFRGALRDLDAIHREQKLLLRGLLEKRDVGYG